MEDLKSRGANSMPRFAIVPQEAEDEILYSFLMRTARANGFNNTKLFFDCYHLKKPGQSITYEYRWDIYRLIEAISKKNEDVFRNSTICNKRIDFTQNRCVMQQAGD